MKKRMSFRQILLACTLVLFGSLNAQVSVPNNQGNSGDFVGWDNTVPNNFPLEIKHELNFPIQWWTDDIQRMVLMQTDAYTVNGWPVQGDGSLLLCPDITQFNGPGPFTRLHLADGFAGSNDHEFIYRDWMKNGITMTGNGDAMYVGQR